MSGMSPNSAFGKGLGLAHEVGLAFGKAGVTAEMMQRVVRDSDFRYKVVDAIKETQTWIEHAKQIENNCHEAFFSRRFNLHLFQETLSKYGRDRIETWKKLGLEVHFLPEVTLNQEDILPGWFFKPDKWFWEQLADGNLLLQDADGNTLISKEANLGGIVALIDTRKEPHYQNGQQVFENDNLLGPILDYLRKDEKIARYGQGLQSSRFGVSPVEWESYVRPACAKKIGVPINRVGFEKTIIANSVPQIYRYMPRSSEGETDTWVWYEERCADNRHQLCGGNNLYGGFASTNCLSVKDHCSAGAIRPLAVLAP